MRVFLAPSTKALQVGGVKTFIQDLRRLLTSLGSTLVRAPDDADLVITNVSFKTPVEPDIVWTHGLYPVGNYPWGTSYSAINDSILASIASSINVVAVSMWGGKLIEKYSGKRPYVIHNGVFYDDIPHICDRDGWVFWPKTSTNPVVSPEPFQLLMQKRPDYKYASYISTAPGKHFHSGSGESVHKILTSTSILLSPTLENSSFLVMEAMSHGIPVLGFNEGMLAEQLTHKVGCYLATPGNSDELAFGLDWLKNNWAQQNALALEHSVSFDWAYQLPLIEDLLASTLEKKRQKKSVSVVITNYNYSRYVGKAIESAKKQTIPCEIVVVDDKSTDKSVDMLSKIPGITLIVHDKNTGPGKARNDGIRASSGTHIISLDADDWLEPSYAERMLAGFTKRNISGCFSALQLMKDNVPSGTWWMDHGAEKDAQLTGKNTVPCATMFSRDWWAAVDGFDEDISLKGTEDANLWLKMFLRGGLFFKVTNDLLVNYRLHEGSLSQTNRPKWNIYTHQKVCNPKYSIILPSFNNSHIWRILETYPEAAIHVIDDPSAKYSEAPKHEWYFFDSSLPRIETLRADSCKPLF